MSFKQAIEFIFNMPDELAGFIMTFILLGSIVTIIGGSFMNSLELLFKILWDKYKNNRN